VTAWLCAGLYGLLLLFVWAALGLAKRADDMDLFDYPNQPGFKEYETAKAAAEAIAPNTPRLRAACLRVIARQPATPDEVAQQLGLSILSIRPRITELSKLKQIEDTGLRRPNNSGRMAKVWRIKETRQ
jgi:hypothetical protein